MVEADDYGEDRVSQVFYGVPSDVWAIIGNASGLSIRRVVRWSFLLFCESGLYCVSTKYGYNRQVL